MKSWELIGLKGTPTEWCAAYTRCLKAAGRAYQPLSAIDTDFPQTFGEGGDFNNRNSVGAALFAHWLFGDKTALEQAKRIGDWLISQRANWDRAHFHRNPWFAPLALALQENGDTGWNKYLYEGFLPSYAFIADSKYFTTWIGSTLRPVIRMFGGAALCQQFWQKLQNAKYLDAPSGVPGPAQLRDMIASRFTTWCNEKWSPTARWGWCYGIGEWDRGTHDWRDFPYLDGKSGPDSGDSMTWFHAGAIVPYEALMIRLTVQKRFPIAWLDRVQTLATHALLYGFDGKSGRNLKSIGYKVDHSTLGVYAPGMDVENDGPYRKWTQASIDDRGELGYQPVDAAILWSDAESEEKKDAIVDWLKTARCIRAGEVPPVTVFAALRYFPS